MANVSIQSVNDGKHNMILEFKFEAQQLMKFVKLNSEFARLQLSIMTCIDNRSTNVVS